MNKCLSHIIYNAGGERAWKLAGDIYQMYVNGVGYVDGADYSKTLYASPYLVVADQEYTKHFYIEGERVCTKIGGHFMLVPTPPNGTPLDFISCNIDEFTHSLRDMVDRGIECTDFNPDYVTISPTIGVMHRKSMLPETNLYFYHPDHLGSSSFITDATGYAVQHLQYLPFGEPKRLLALSSRTPLKIISESEQTFVDQQNGYDSRYTFSAKEKDDETQYSYFGARYYDSDLSVWLSVDPMADKFPRENAFMYCGGNPVYYKDIKGNFKFPTRLTDEGITYEQDFANKYPTMYKYLKNTNAEKGSIMDLTKSDRFINAMIKNSGGKLTKEQIVKDFQYGGGQVINVGDQNYYNSKYDEITLSKDMLSCIENAVSDFDKQAAMTWGVSTVAHEYLEKYTDDNDMLNGEQIGCYKMEEDVWGVNIFDFRDGKRAVNARNGVLNKNTGTDFEIDMSVIPVFFDMSVEPPVFIDNTELSE